MNKVELVNSVAAKAKISKADALRAVNAVSDVIVSAVKKGDKVTLVGFGTYQSSKREARKGRNPKTGEVIQIKATRVPVFKAGKAFKDAVRDGKGK